MRLLSARSRYNQSVTANAVQQLASADFPTPGASSASMVSCRIRFRWKPARRGSRRLGMGDVQSAPPLVRVHSQCLTGDVFHSLRCDCRQQLEMALAMIRDLARAYLSTNSRKTRHWADGQLQAYELQDAGLDTVEANERLGFKADQRDFALPADAQSARSQPSAPALSNNPEKVEALERAGIAVVERVPCEVAASPHAEEYLKTKERKARPSFLVAINRFA